MATKYPDIFAALVAPFDAQKEVKQRTGTGGKSFQYVTARTLMNRLDEVLGPENWWDSYRPGEKSVICELTIRLPDGSVITKADAGGYAGMADAGDDDKSGYSDAFKRATAKFGPGRYLYRDGVPSFGEVPQDAPEARQQQRSQHEAPPMGGQSNGSQQAPPSGGKNWPTKPRSGKALFAVLRELEQRHDIELVSALNTWLKQSQIDSRLVDLDADQISKAWVWLCNFATKQGWITAEAINGQSQQPSDSNGQGLLLKSMQTKLWEQTKQWCIKVMGGEQNVTNALVLTEIDKLHSHYSPGEIIERLGQLVNVEILKRMLETAHDRLATDSDIPY